MSPIPKIPDEPYNFPESRFRSVYPAVGAQPDYNPDNFRPDNFTQGAGWPTTATIFDHHIDRVVVSRNQLKQAVNNSDPATFIWIPNHVTLDVAGMEDLSPAEGVTIASGRGRPLPSGGYAAGAMLRMYDENNPSHPLFNVQNELVRFSGLRFKAPQLEYADWNGYDEETMFTGISVNADNVEIRNCTFRGFTHAGVEVGRQRYVEKTHVHHCDLVDNPQDALGYGVTVFHGKPLIQYNYMDHNRHSISADGAEDCEYVARYNIVGRHPILHQFDMHGDEDTEVNGRPRAGRSVSIHHNIFDLEDSIKHDGRTEAIKIRGQPIEKAQIVKNWFGHPQPLSGPSEHDGSAIQLEYGGAGEDWVQITMDGNVNTNVYGIPGPDTGVGLDHV